MKKSSNPQTEKCKLFLKVTNASNGICLTSLPLWGQSIQALDAH